MTIDPDQEQQLLVQLDSRRYTGDLKTIKSIDKLNQYGNLIKEIIDLGSNPGGHLDQLLSISLKNFHSTKWVAFVLECPFVDAQSMKKMFWELLRYSTREDICWPLVDIFVDHGYSDTRAAIDLRDAITHNDSDNNGSGSDYVLQRGRDIISALRRGADFMALSPREIQQIAYYVPCLRQEITAMLAAIELNPNTAKNKDEMAPMLTRIRSVVKQIANQPEPTTNKKTPFAKSRFRKPRK